MNNKIKWLIPSAVVLLGVATCSYQGDKVDVINSENNTTTDMNSTEENKTSLASTPSHKDSLDTSGGGDGSINNGSSDSMMGEIQNKEKVKPAIPTKTVQKKQELPTPMALYKEQTKVDTKHHNNKYYVDATTQKDSEPTTYIANESGVYTKSVLPIKSENKAVLLTTVLMVDEKDKKVQTIHNEQKETPIIQNEAVSPIITDTKPVQIKATIKDETPVTKQQDVVIQQEEVQVIPSPIVEAKTEAQTLVKEEIKPLTPITQEVKSESQIAHEQKEITSVSKEDLVVVSNKSKEDKIENEDPKHKPFKHYIGLSFNFNTLTVNKSDQVGTIVLNKPLETSAGSFLFQVGRTFKEKYILSANYEIVNLADIKMNSYYLSLDYKLPYVYNPYIGFSLGMSDLQWQYDPLVNSQTKDTKLSSILYGLQTGVVIPIEDEWSFYSQLSYQKLDFKTNLTSTPAKSTVTHEDKKSLGVGVRVSF